MGTVMAFGTFDFFHSGHLHYLKKAKRLGKRLVVVVSRGQNSRLLKGKTPVRSEKDRLKVIQQLKLVDKAVLGDRQLRSWGVVKRFHPSAIALGYDQWPSIPSLREELEKAGLQPRIVRISSFKGASKKK